MLSSIVLSLAVCSAQMEVGPLDLSYSTIRCEFVGSLTQCFSVQTRLVVDGQRIYFLSQFLDGDSGPQSLGREYLYDGSVVCTANSTGLATIRRPTQVEHSRSNLFLDPYADAVGFDLPNMGCELGEATAYFDRASVCFDGDLDSIAEETRCLRGDAADGTTRVWRLDVLDGLVVVTESETWWRGTLLRRCVNSDIVRIGDCLIPKAVHCEQFSYSDGKAYLSMREDIVMESAIADVQGFPTALHYMRPGSQVKDGRRSEAETASDGYVVYRVPEPIEEMKKEWELRARPVPEGAPWRVYLLGAAAGLAASFAILSISKRSACS